MIDWQTIGGGATALGMLATGAWAWWLKNLKAKAVTRADVAEAGAAEKVAKAEGSVYSMLESRLQALEVEVKDLRTDLAAERRHSHELERKSNRMELHILRLEHLMRAANLEPPPFPTEG